MDSQRIRELLTQGLQLGTGEALRAKLNAQDFGTLGQLVRFQGKPEDINAWRIYLKAWDPETQPQQGTGVVRAYGKPYPWVNLDPSKTTPQVLDDFFDIAVYAQVKWGAGGVTHTAFVDWPRRGCLFQVSGSSVYVDAVACGVSNPGVIVLGTGIPFLSASIGLEPGGGDSEACGTYTYPRQDPTSAGPPISWRFQVPPYARSFKVLARRAALKAANAGPLTIQTIAVHSGKVIEAEWEDDFTVNQDQQLADYPITRRAEDVVLTLANKTVDNDTNAMGLVFSLDL